MRFVIYLRSNIHGNAVDGLLWAKICSKYDGKLSTNWFARGYFF